MAKEMTVEEAVRLIKESYEFGSEFDAAVAYLKEHDAENEVLIPLKDEQSVAKVKKARAKAYLQQALADEEYDERMDEALKLLKDDKAVQEETADEQEVFDEENHLNMQDEEAVLRNTQKISEMADSFEKDQANADELNTVKEKVEVVDDSGQTLTVDEAQKYWNSLLESAKQQAIMLRAGDTKFFMKKEEEKRQTLNRDIKDFWAIGLAQGVAGSAMDTPDEKQVAPESKDYAKYVKSQAVKAEKTLSDLFEEGNKVKVKTGFFLHNAVETSKKMASYAHRWLQKGFKKVALVFDKRREAYDSKMKKLFGKAYEVKQAAAEHIKNNKWRLFADTAATGIVAVSAGSGLALPVIAGYAVYSAAGSWVWPLVEKKTKAIREAKKAGKNAEEWTGFKGLKKAFAAIKSDEKEYKKYKNRAYTGTGFGIAGAGLVAGMGAASGWVADKAGVATARLVSTVVRSVGSLTNQGLNYHDVKKDFKADPSAENRARLKQAKIGLGLGSVIALAGNFMSFAHVEKVATAENSGGFMDKVKGIFSKNDSIAQTDTANVAAAKAEVLSGNGSAGNLGKAAVDNAADAADAAAVVPTEYSADMGISESHWAEMQRKLPGIFENHAKIFGKEDIDSQDMWQETYQNLDNAMKANPEYFGNLTKEQVLYKYMKLIETTEQASVGPKGMLVTKLDENGLPMYNGKERTEVMRALNDIILCGKKVKVPAAKIGQMLDYVDEKRGGYIGPDADRGITNNRYVGGRMRCGDDYQNAWERAARKVAAHHQHVAPQPVVEAEPVPAPAPAPEPEKQPIATEEVVVNEAPAKKPVHISEEVVNETPAQRKVVINEGATDGNLDVNSNKVRGRSRSFTTRSGRD